MLKAFFKDAPFGMSVIFIILAIGFVYIAMPVFGNSALIVRSGSMQPAIAVGDLVTVRPQTDYKTGEIVAFHDPIKSSAIVTHRIVAKVVKNNQVFYQTKGDANEETDFSLVAGENIIGRADFSVKGIGKLLAFTKTKEGFLATVALPALLVILLEINNIIKEVRKIRVSKNTSEVGLLALSEVEGDSWEVRRVIKTLYHHYGKPMGLPHPNASFRSLFYIILRAKSRSHLKNYYNFSGKFSTSSNNTSIIFRSIFPIMAAFLLIGNTFSFFSDTETSTGNTFTAAESFPHVVINEVYYDPDADHMQGGGPTPDENDFEWIELYNPTGSAVNLKDWKITDNTGPERTISTNNLDLDPGEFAVLAKAANVFTLWSIPSSAEEIPLGQNFGNGLSNSTHTGDRVILKDDSGIVIDQMSYAGDTTAFTPSAQDVAEGHSLERDPDGVDTDTIGDFVDRTTPTPGT